MRLLKTYFRQESHPLPAKPTTTQPGSKEKLEVLRKRVLAGEALWHPQDRQEK
jgi:hypothetical protein